MMRCCCTICPRSTCGPGRSWPTEALVRWRHPTWGLLLPESFIGVAESANLGGDLGRWVMRTAMCGIQSVAF